METKKQKFSWLKTAAKKLFIIFALAIAFSGVVTPIGLAYAADTPAAPATCTGPGGATIPCDSTGNPLTVASPEVHSPIGKAIAGATKAVTDFLGNWSMKLLLQILIWIVEITLIFVGFFLWLCGEMFNIVVTQLVVDMGHYVTSSSAQGVRIAWQVCRDLANIGIIGGIIATAIGTIIHMPNVNAQKWIVRLIIAALLVNFSYFFAGAVIDSSNFLATQIYKSTISTGACQSTASCTIVDKFMEVANIQNLRDSQGNKLATFGGTLNITTTSSGGNDGMVQLLQRDILLLIFELVTIFVFLSAVALLIGRFVALIFVLISSPIGIAGVAIPKIEKYAKEWWETLFSQAFFAPVYFLLLGFSFTILENSKGAILSSTVGLDQTVGLALTFIVAVVFMLQSLRIAKQMAESSKRLADAYKFGNAVAGWAPKAYVSGMKYVGSSVGTGTLGLAADRFGRSYEKWVASGGAIPKLLAGSGLDRGIQKGFQTVADKKFGGKEGYQTRLEEQEKRKARLAEVKTSKDNLDEVAKSGGLLDAHLAATTEHDKFEKENEDQGKAEDKIAKKKFGKIFSALSKDQKEEVMRDADWKREKASQTLDNLAEAKHGPGKDWAALDDKERKDLIEEAIKSGHWKGREWKKDKKTGRWGWEGGFDYRDRLRRKVDLRTAEEIEKAPEEEHQITLQGSLDKMRSAMSEVSYDYLKEEQRRDPKLFTKIAKALSNDQTAKLIADATVSRQVKNEVRRARLGGIMQEAKDFEERVIDLKEWEKLSKEDREGKILRGSEEYHEFRGRLHETLKKYYSDDEIVDYVESDEGIKDGMRKNKVFNDAAKNAVFKKLDASKKISAGERRDMRGFKRKRLTDANDMDIRADDIFTAEGVTSAGARETAMEVVTDPMTEGAISYEVFEEQWKKLGKDTTKEGRIFHAAWLQKTAEVQAEKYFEGKAPGEVDSEVKQEVFGGRVLGKSMRKEQLQASQKDQGWKDKQATAMAIHGSKETVGWLKNSPDGQNFTVDWDEVERKRKELGMASVDEYIGGTTEGTSVEPKKVELEETAIQRVQRALDAAREPVGPESAPQILTPEEMKERVHELSPQEMAEMVSEMSEENLRSPTLLQLLDMQHLETIYADGRISKKKKDRLIMSMLTMVHMGQPVDNSAIAWLRNMHQQGRLTTEQEAAYQETLGNR